MTSHANRKRGLVRAACDSLAISLPAAAGIILP